MKRCDVLVIGAGFAGAVCAERLASEGFTVVVVDRRTHIGGNAYDRFDAHGVLIHPYGPHIFHTNSRRVFQYLSQFTHWRFYEHRVLANVWGKLVPFPINRITLQMLYGRAFSEIDAEEFLSNVRVPINPVRNSEDLVISSVGSELCDLFYRGYTLKQWGLDLSQLSPGVAARIPVRANDDDRYFTDQFQFMPADGYTAMFQRMLGHPSIEILLGIDFVDANNTIERRHTVYTGPIDAYFQFRYGALPYRSLRFEHEHFSTHRAYQATGTINYPTEQAYTRVTEFKHLTGQSHRGTSIVYEYPTAEGDPFYPVPRPENEARYKAYAKLAEAEARTTFVGRLAEYRYFNMDQVVGAALEATKKVLHELRAGLSP